MAISPDHFSEFLQRLGHTVREVQGMRWFNTSRGVYTCFPYDQNVDAQILPLHRVLGRDGIVARFGCPLNQGVSSHRFICDDREYDFPNLRSRTRTQVRRGLEECRVEPVGFDVLRQSAISLNADTLIRQGRRVPTSLEKYWQRYFSAAEVTAGAEAWGAFVDDDLAAYLIAFVIDTTINVLIVRSATAHLKKLPNNALLFKYLHDRMRDPSISRISYGYASIQDGLGSLDQFKTGMGFRADPCGQRVEVARWVRPLLNSYTLPVLRRTLKGLGAGETSAKLQGILNWYQQQPAIESDHFADQRARSAA